MRIELTRRQAEELLVYLSNAGTPNAWDRPVDVLDDIYQKIRNKLKATQE